MVGTRTYLAVTLLCLVYFIARLKFVKYDSFPTVKVDLPGSSGLQLPSIKWGGESGSNDNSDASVSLHKWLMKRGLMPGKAVPIVTIADASYLHILHATQHRLAKWGYDRSLVVLCLDEVCAKDSELLNPFPGYLLGDDAAMHAVAFFKFMANLNLAENGYAFVFLDADVFFTGSRDPFGVMLPLSNKTWDLQFQSDGGPGALNIGWYFARPTPATRNFFRLSFAHWIHTKTDEWDQLVMNKVKDGILAKEAALAAEISAGSNDTSEPSTPPLHVHMVELKHFRNFMLELWSPELFGNQTVINDYISTAAAIHYTCVQHDLKEYFGLNYGGFGDLHGYYSRPPPLLRPVGISGTADAVHKQVAFALALGKNTNSTVAWPDTVNVFQGWDDGKYHFQPRFPGAKAVSWPSAKGAGYAVVEGQYLQNRVREGLDSPTEEVHLSLKECIDQADSAPGSNWLYSLRKKLGAREGFSVVNLDFTDVGAEWSPLMDLSVVDQPGYDEWVREVEAKFHTVFRDSGMEEFSSLPLAELGLCRWVNGGDGCLSNC